MKRILAPTDFSQAAQNAVEYAVQLALLTEAELTLFHVFHVPPLSIQIPNVEISIQQIRQESLDALENIKQNLQTQYGEKLQISCDNRFGFAGEGINDFAIENDMDLIVMGMQGANFLNEMLVGSITTSLMKDAPCPVLVIGSNMRFSIPRTFVWAHDGLKMPSTETLVKLKDLLRVFPNAKTHILHIANAYQNKGSFEQKVSPILDTFFEFQNYSLHQIKHENIVEGIQHFSDTIQADILIMTPRKHAIWRNLFFESNSKRMAFSTKIPLLILQA